MKSRLFILEESQIVAKALGYLLSETEIVSTKTYEEAVEVLKNQPADYLMAFVDFNLPDEHSGKSIDLVLGYDIPTVLITTSLSDEIQEFIWSKKVMDYVVNDSPHALGYLLSLVHQIKRNKNTKILIVDDSPIARMHIKKVLSIQQYIVLEASSGEEALKRLEEEEGIKLAIIDYQMPNMNGFELLTKIRTKYSYDRLAIIGLSGDATQKLSVKLMKYGANDFIFKPFLSEQLYSRVSQNIRIIEAFETVKELTYTDPLTNLYNRRYFFEIGKTLFNNTKRTSVPFVIAMLDVDFFKHVNDTYGHSAGDDMLKIIANIMKTSFRGSDVIARFGGEEFCIFLTNIGKTDALRVLDALRLKIQSQNIEIKEKIVRVTVSIGVCTGLKENLDDMIKEADSRLYQAKENGRNQVVMD